MKPPDRRLAALALGLGLFAWAGFYLAAHFQEFRSALVFRPWPLAALTLLILAHYAALGLFNRRAVAAFGVRLSFTEWFGLGLVSTLGNYILPFRGGAGIRGLYLKGRHALPLTTFMITFAAFMVLSLLAAGLAGLGALVFLTSLATVEASVLALFFALVSLAALMVAFFPVSPAWFKRSWLRPLGRLAADWRLIMGRGRLAFDLLFWVLAYDVVQCLMIYAAFAAMDIHLGLGGVVMVTALLSLTSLVTITPGGLGVQEAALVLTTSLLGVGPAQALAVALLIRAVVMATAFLLGPVFSYLLFHRALPPGKKGSARLDNPSGRRVFWKPDDKVQNGVSHKQ